MPAFKWQTNATQDTVQFVKGETKHKKMNRRESKERKFDKKVRETGWVVLKVVFVSLSSTVVQKLNQMFVFGILFICYDWLLRLLLNDLKFSRVT